MSKPMIYIVNHWISAVQLLDRTCVHVMLLFSYDCEILSNKTLIKIYTYKNLYGNKSSRLKTVDVEGLVIL